MRICVGPLGAQLHLRTCFHTSGFHQEGRPTLIPGILPSFDHLHVDPMIAAANAYTRRALFPNSAVLAFTSLVDSFHRQNVFDLAHPTDSVFQSGVLIFHADFGERCV